MLGLKKEGGEDFGSILRLRVDAVRYENNRNDLNYYHHSYADAGIKLSGYKLANLVIKKQQNHEK